MAQELTPQEIAAVNRKALEFLERYKSVPQSEKAMDSSQKLSGAVGLHITPEEGDNAHDE